LGYPVLQAADILLPRAHLVPVGKDNQSHVEITREIARRFNNLYGELFPLPDDLVEGDTLPGTDGQAKMSKSLGNTIFLSDDAAAVRKKVFSMYTDPNRVRADIPGTVEGNPVFTYLDYFDPDKAGVEELKARYRAGRVGDVEVKDRLAAVLNAFLGPVRERAAYYAAQSGLVDEVIYNGTLHMREVGAETLREVKKTMGLTGAFNRIARKAEERAKRKPSEGVP
jgi:tryptophanyl-tRNA synthetase